MVLDIFFLTPKVLTQICLPRPVKTWREGERQKKRPREIFFSRAEKSFLTGTPNFPPPVKGQKKHIFLVRVGGERAIGFFPTKSF